MTVFLLINRDESRDIPARVRVAYALPQDKVLVTERIDEIRVIIRGPWRRIKRFDEREIDRIDIDLTDVQNGEVVISPDMIDLPRGLELLSIEPKVIRVAFEDLEVARVEVAPTWGGRPLHGWLVAETAARVAPATVVVRGAAGVVRALSSVRTQEIRLDGRSGSFEASVAVLPPEGVEVEGDPMVQVTVPIREELVTRQLGAVPLVVELPPGVDAARWEPAVAAVKIELTGGLLAVERLIDKGIHPTVTVTPEVVARGQKLVAPVRLDGVPRGVGVTVTPAEVVVTPRK